MEHTFCFGKKTEDDFSGINDVQRLSHGTPRPTSRHAHLPRQLVLSTKRALNHARNPVKLGKDPTEHTKSFRLPFLGHGLSRSVQQ